MDEMTLSHIKREAVDAETVMLDQKFWRNPIDSTTNYSFQMERSPTMAYNVCF
jgi:hypothetical protein